MAFQSGGSVWLGSSPNIKLTVNYEVTRNLEDVSIRLQLGVSGISGGSYYGYNLTATPAINGVTKSVVTLKNNTPNQWSAFSKTTSYYATKVPVLSQTTMPLSVVFASNSGRSKTLNFSAVLPSVAPSTIATPFSFTVGEDLPIVIQRVSDTFKETAQVRIRDYDLGKVWQITDTSYTLPLSEYEDVIFEKVTDELMAEVTVVLSTFDDNGNLIGTTENTGYVNMEVESACPTFEGFALSSNVESLTGDASIILPGQTNLKITIPTPAQAQKYAQMGVYVAVCGNVEVFAEYDSQNSVEIVLEKVSATTLSVLAYDSRGNKTQLTQTMTALDYVQPAIGSISLNRDNEVDTPVKLRYSGTIWNKSFGVVENTIVQATWKYRVNGTETWIDGQTVILPTIEADTTYSFEGYIEPTIGEWEQDKSYQIAIALMDQLNTVNAVATINVGIPGIYMQKVGGTYRVGIGKTPQNGTLDIAGSVKDICINGVPLIELLHPVGDIVFTMDNTSPQERYGGIWEQVKDVFLLAAGDKYVCGTTGGEDEHTLTLDEMPSHMHQIYGMLNATTGGSGAFNYYRNSPNEVNLNTYPNCRTQYAGNGKAHNNMPPYLTVYVWKRVA